MEKVTLWKIGIEDKKNETILNAENTDKKKRDIVVFISGKTYFKTKANRRNI